MVFEARVHVRRMVPQDRESDEELTIEFLCCVCVCVCVCVCMSVYIDINNHVYYMSIHIYIYVRRSWCARARHEATGS